MVYLSAFLIFCAISPNSDKFSILYVIALLYKDEDENPLKIVRARDCRGLSAFVKGSAKDEGSFFDDEQNNPILCPIFKIVREIIVNCLIYH